MKILNNIRIKNKIIIIIFSVGALTTLIGSTLNYFYQVHKSKSLLITNTLLQAKLMSEYCGLPLEFNYPDNATDALEKLYSIPDIYDGVLFALNDSVFASYHRIPNTITAIPEKLKQREYFIEGDFLHVSQAVIYKDKTYGTLYLRSLYDWRKIATSQLLVTLSILAIMLLILFILASVLHRNISDPIVELTEKMNIVAKNKDYSVQFPAYGKDEIGELYAGFNTMLSEIEKREIAFKTEKVRAETYLNIAEVLLVALDIDGNITMLNRKGCKLLGYDQGELIGKNWFKLFVPPEEKENVYGVYKSIVRGEVQAYRYFENYIITKQGEKRLIAWNNTYVTDKDANIIGSLSSGEDITERKLMEEALNDEKQRLSIILKGTDAGTWEWNIQTGEAIFNARWAEIIGYTLEELSPVSIDTWIKYSHPEDILVSGELLEKHFRGDLEYYECEVRMKHKNGEWVWVLTRGKVHEWDETGKPLFMSGTHQEITERKRAEEAIRASEKLFSMIFKASPVSISIANVADGKLTEVNETWCKLMGFTKEEVIGHNVEELKIVTAEERKTIREEFLRRGNLRLLEGVITIKNGEKRDVLTSADLILIKGVQVSINLVIDITERKRNIEALRQSEEKFRILIERLPIPITLLDTNGKITFRNEQFVRVFGYTEDDLQTIEQWWVKAFPDEEYRQYVQNMRNEAMKLALEKEKTLQAAELYVTCKNGEQRIIELLGIMLGNTTLSVFVDHTERKKIEIKLKENNDEIEAQNKEYLQLNEELNFTNEELYYAKEKAEESDRLKTAFLQNMSHEIRTPMNAIMGFSELLVHNYNNRPKLENFSAIIRQRCKDLLDIINDILDIAKIESGQLPVNIEECNLNDLFTELTSFFIEYQKRNDKQQIRFNLQALCIPSEICIVTDKVKLKQIFINLIGNAFKYTDEGSIEGGCRTDANGNLIFYVSDTGIGIPPDKQQVIFERFAQLHQNVTKNIGGTGLGLSIVKGLVGLLGGEVFLASEPGKGTTFSFTIPYKTVHKVHRDPILIEETEGFHFSGRTILVVEDDLYNAEYLKEILSHTGMSILHTVYGKEAIQIALSQPLDIVLMDIRLPDIDGYEATRQIKLHKPLLIIIAQTAYASHQDKQKAIKAGCTDYISKPTAQQELISMIKKHLLQQEMGEKNI